MWSASPGRYRHLWRLRRSEMSEAIGNSLPLAVGVAVTPSAIIAVVLMLASSRARVNGPLFLLGWLVGVPGRGAPFCDHPRAGR